MDGVLFTKNASAINKREEFFKMNLDYHQKYMDVIKRKPAKLTEFLNELATFIRKEHENKGYR